MNDDELTRDPNVTTWADGFGVWYARVPRNCVSPLIAARRAIRDEIVSREAPREVRREIWMHPTRREDLDDENTIVYRENTADPESTCRHCKRRIVMEDGRWIDPEATGDDSVWRETCDGNDTFTAEHEPQEEGEGK